MAIRGTPLVEVDLRVGLNMEHRAAVRRLLHLIMHEGHRLLKLGKPLARLSKRRYERWWKVPWLHRRATK